MHLWSPASHQARSARGSCLLPSCPRFGCFPDAAKGVIPELRRVVVGCEVQSRALPRSPSYLVAVTLWTPPGANLGTDGAPEPDSRMVNFAGLNGGGHSGYHELRRQAAEWATTSATPNGPSELLSTSRDCYAQGYYAYGLFAVGGVWSITAIEAALRMKLDADRKTKLSELVKTAERAGYLPERGWDDGRLDAGRQLRNKTMHGDDQQLWTPAMARGVIAASHEAVASLFPDADDQH